eukprot:353420-Chlamydomonas_euryale.AAC.1
MSRSGRGGGSGGYYRGRNRGGARGRYPSGCSGNSGGDGSACDSSHNAAASFDACRGRAAAGSWHATAARPNGPVLRPEGLSMRLTTQLRCQLAARKRHARYVQCVLAEWDAPRDED